MEGEGRKRGIRKKSRRAEKKEREERGKNIIMKRIKVEGGLKKRLVKVIGIDMDILEVKKQRKKAKKRER